MKFSKIKIMLKSVATLVITSTYTLLIVLINQQDFQNKKGIFAFWIAFLLFINYIISISLCFYIINSKRNYSIQVAWIFVIFLIPLLGQLLFLIFGVSGIKRHNFLEYQTDVARYHKYENYQFTDYILQKERSIKWRSFIYLAKSYQRPIYKNNVIKFNATSGDTLQEITKILNLAQDFIHLEYYYIADQLVWQHILTILKEKIAAGVEVRIIVDCWGNLKYLSKKKIKALRALGIKFRFFNPPFLKKLPIAFWNFRCHKKAIIVDNKYAVYGSANISDAYFGISKTMMPVDDYTFSLEGEIVNSINLSFASDWDKYTRNPNKEPDLFTNPNRYFKIHQPQTPTPNTFLQIGQSGPDLEEKIIISNIIQIINLAKKSVWIATPYFIPPRSLVQALITAAYSGIEIKLLLPNQAVHLKKIIIALTRRNYAQLIHAGIQIYEYHGFNHEKTILVDQEIVYTGSYNWDCRSLYMNYESILQINSLAITSQLKAAYLKRLEKSDLIRLEDLTNLYNWKTKTLAWLMQIFYPLI